jgi:hypothetical protein
VNARFSFQQCETTKDIPACVQNERECVRVTVASPVKVSRAETVADSAPHERKPLPAELVEERRKGRDSPRVERSCPGLQYCNRALLPDPLHLERDFRVESSELLVKTRNSTILL